MEFSFNTSIKLAMQAFTTAPITVTFATFRSAAAYFGSVVALPSVKKLEFIFYYLRPLLDTHLTFDIIS
jgi:hypothetical protein